MDWFFHNDSDEHLLTLYSDISEIKELLKDLLLTLKESHLLKKTQFRDPMTYSKNPGPKSFDLEGSSIKC